MTRSPDDSRLSASRLGAAVALLGALAGGVGCASAPPRKMSFDEAGLLEPGPADPRTDAVQPDVPRPPAARPDAPRPDAARAVSRPAALPMGPLSHEGGPLPPPVRDVAPEAFATMVPEGPPIDPALIRFAGEARNRRASGSGSHGFPIAAEQAWSALGETLDLYLARPLPQTPLLELVRASVTLDTEWELDRRQYGPPSPGLNQRVQDRASRLALRIRTSRALGETMFVIRSPGRLHWPIPNAGLSSGFGLRDHPLNGTRQFHGGIDLVADLGKVVSAAGPGYVVSAGWAGGYGLLVEVRHAGELTTRYGHLSALLCAPGDPVELGKPLGLVGLTGLTTGPHLHFEVWEGGQPRDPLIFIGGGSGLAGAHR